MLTQKTVTIPASTKTVSDKIICELCSAETKFSNQWSHGQSSWANEIFNIQTVEISLREGEQYPEGDFTKTKILDMCADCFRNKLIPWFEQQGGNIREYESET